MLFPVDKILLPNEEGTVLMTTVQIMLLECFLVQLFVLSSIKILLFILGVTRRIAVPLIAVKEQHGPLGPRVFTFQVYVSPWRHEGIWLHLSAFNQPHLLLASGEGSPLRVFHKAPKFGVPCADLLIDLCEAAKRHFGGPRPHLGKNPHLHRAWGAKFDFGKELVSVVAGFKTT